MDWEIVSDDCIQRDPQVLFEINCSSGHSVFTELHADDKELGFTWTFMWRTSRAPHQFYIFISVVLIFLKLFRRVWSEA